MNTNLWRVSADVPSATRAQILRMFPPAFSQVFARSVTWAYRVTDEFSFPDSVGDMTIYAHHKGDTSECLLVSFCGNRFRPDGDELFLTLSTAPGVEPVQAGQIKRSQITPIENRIVFGTQFQRNPLWKQKPQLVAA